MTDAAFEKGSDPVSVRHLVLNRTSGLGDIMSGGADIFSHALDGIAGTQGYRGEGEENQ